MKITWLLATLLLCPALAQAIDLCVASDSQFSNALLAAQITPGSSKIKLVRGVTFHVPPALDPASSQFSSELHDLTIEGGYASGCSDASYQLAPTATVVTGIGSGGIWISGRGTVRLSNMTFKSFPSIFAIFALTNTPLNVRLTHVRFVNGIGVHLQFATSDSSVVIDNSLFAQQSAPGTSGSALSFFQTEDTSGLSVRLTNNTLADNSHDGLTVDGAAADVSLFNNIVFGSGGSDLVSAQPVLAIANTIGTHIGAYAPGSNANLTSDPQFVSPTNYNIKTSSPAYDSGLSSPPGGLSAYDIEGEDRIVGGSVDRGAYENNNSGATILLVTNTNDSGPGSLRTAIIDANANPVDNIIGFNISGSCPRKISLNTELPAITGNLSIRGYTQPGAKPNTSGISDNATICVELVEAAGHTIANGLHFDPTPSATSQDVSGLAIGNFLTGILFNGQTSGGPTGCSIWGNFIGLAADGTTLRANTTFGIYIDGGAQCLIGGDDNAQRNVIAGASRGIRMATAYEDVSHIRNNYIGTTRSGNSARPNAIGIHLLSSRVHVSGNLISGNSSSGVVMDYVLATENTIQDNRIGLKAFAICIPPCAPDYNALGNGSHGILISGGSVRNSVNDNVIAFNAGAGVYVTDSGSVDNAISFNSIFANEGLGIDLGTEGVDAIDNDVTAPPNTPNGGINAPLLDLVFGGIRTGSAYGRLQTANGDYYLEFFSSDACDPSGHGEGRQEVGSAHVIVENATATQNGQEYFTAVVASSSDLPGKAITATVRRKHGGYGATSEFSQCKPFEFVDKIFADGFEPMPE